MIFSTVRSRKNYFLGMAPKEFSGKVVIITGASSGIGACVSWHFANLGASLVLTGRNTQNLRKTEQKCSASPKVHLVTADLTILEDLQRIVVETIDMFGKIDVLVNNAGIIDVADFEDTTVEKFDSVFNTNVRAVFQLTKLTLPYLKLTKGNIVNVSSITGFRSIPGMIIYSMSKACLEHFTALLAHEQGANGIRVNAICPGPILTKFYSNIGHDEASIQMSIDFQKTLHPLGRVGQTDEVAEAITFLASNRARFITGTVLPVDGGRSLLCGTMFPNSL